jgi:O-Antigen ligase
MPLQENIPTVAGFSFMYIIFGVLGGYVLLTRPSALARISVHPVFLAAYTLLCLGLLIESMHSSSSYFELRRFGYMVAGAIVIASLCRDRPALQLSIYGYLITGIWMSAFLILGFYDSLEEATALSLHEANTVRAEIFESNSLATGLNEISFTTAQSVVVALALALTAFTSLRRILFLGIAIICAVATFIPMSRGGILIAFISYAAVMLTHRGKRMRAIIATVILGAGILTWVPHVALTRVLSSMSSSYYSSLISPAYQVEADGRSRIFSAAIEHLPEYLWTGIGAGNFWGWWGSSNGFGTNYSTVGAHNGLLQVMIYWGLPGLLVLIAVIWTAYRCLPKASGADSLSLSLLGISITLLLWMMISHTLHSKVFSLGLGLLVGTRCWIWPNGIVQPTFRQIRQHCYIKRSRAGTV